MSVYPRVDKLDVIASAYGSGKSAEARKNSNNNNNRVDASGSHNFHHS
jgi:hypothetical protein